MKTRKSDHRSASVDAGLSAFVQNYRVPVGNYKTSDNIKNRAGVVPTPRARENTAEPAVKIISDAKTYNTSTKHNFYDKTNFGVRTPFVPPSFEKQNASATKMVHCFSNNMILNSASKNNLFSFRNMGPAAPVKNVTQQQTTVKTNNVVMVQPPIASQPSLGANALPRPMFLGYQSPRMFQLHILFRKLEYNPANHMS